MADKVPTNPLVTNLRSLLDNFLDVILADVENAGADNLCDICVPESLGNGNQGDGVRGSPCRDTGTFNIFLYFFYVFSDHLRLEHLIYFIRASKTIRKMGHFTALPA